MYGGLKARLQYVYIHTIDKHTIKYESLFAQNHMLQWNFYDFIVFTDI